MDPGIILLVLIAAAALWGSFWLDRRSRTKTDAAAGSYPYMDSAAVRTDFTNHRGYDSAGDNGGVGGGSGDAGGGGGDGGSGGGN
ncbi:hypothetical protein [Taklimakanibacter deserti]|uniref:hypothetical protein n=1 Tax=Taklimakanibacter deserti TaxID=2267839 RepID=UPI0013C43B8E